MNTDNLRDTALTRLPTVYVASDANLSTVLAGQDTRYVIQYGHTVSGGGTINIGSGSILDFQGGYIDGGTLNGNETIIVAPPYRIFGQDIDFSGTFVAKTVYVEWFYMNANLDELVDDRENFKKLSNFINCCKRCDLIFPKEKSYYAVIPAPQQPYTVNGIYPELALLCIENASHIHINFNKCTIQVNAGNLPWYYIVFLRNCRDVLVRNGILIGDRRSHDYTAYGTFTTHEWGHGLALFSCVGEVCNMDISECTGDSVYSGYYKKTPSGGSSYNLGKHDIWIHDCELHHSRRQGLTISECDNFIAEGLHIHHIGTFDGYAGTAPMSAIDMEFEANNHYSDNIVIRNCHIHECPTKSITSGTQTVGSLLIDNCVIENSGAFRPCNLTVNNRAQVGNCKIDAGKTSYLYADFFNCIISCNISSRSLSNIWYVDGDKSKFTNCQFISNVSSSGSTGYNSMIIAGYESDKSVVFNGCTFENILGKYAAEEYSGFVKEQGTNARGFVFEDCKFKNCGSTKNVMSMVFRNCDIDCFFGNQSMDVVEPWIFEYCKIKNFVCGAQDTYLTTHHFSLLMRYCENIDDATTYSYDYQRQGLLGSKIEAYHCRFNINNKMLNYMNKLLRGRFFDCSIRLLSAYNTPHMAYSKLYNCVVDSPLMIQSGQFTGTQVGSIFVDTSSGYSTSGNASAAPSLSEEEFGISYTATDLNNTVLYWSGTMWADANGRRRIGTTAQRPTLTSGDSGFMYYDISLSAVVTWDGSNWV